MRFFKPLNEPGSFCSQQLVNALICIALFFSAFSAFAQNLIQPSIGASCTISALNRNAPVAPDNSFTIYNIPGSSGPFRARATCSDGTVGQTPVTFPEYGSTVVYTGDLIWGRLDPTPVALGLSSASKRLSTNQTSQLVATAISDNASTRDVTPRSQGTNYVVSNSLMASVTQDGLIQILPLFATGSSARVVTTATNEGGVAASYMFILGPRGALSGKVVRADGVTAVPGAQVTIIRNQPMEQVGTVVTDSYGNYSMSDVNAGTFSVSVIDPQTGDRGQTTSKIDVEGEAKTADIKLNGQGQVVVTVVDATNNTVPNAIVTLTALGAYRDTRTIATDSLGKVTFSNVAAGDFTVSTRDPISRLLGALVAVLPVGGQVQLTLKLQPVGTINGYVFGVDGATLQEGVQVRILSRERGIVSQSVTGSDGRFSFDSLPLSDGPYTLDVVSDGRLRARVAGLVLSTPNQVVSQDIRFGAIGTVRGIVTDSNNQPFEEVSLTLQSLDGLRLTFTAKAGRDGNYLFSGVPVGNFTLSASTKDGRTGSATGNIPNDGAQIAVNLQLASTGIVGTVFQRDGVTPVGSGVQVYLQRHPKDVQLMLTLSSQSDAVLASAITNSQGQFSFAISAPDIYVVQAQDVDNRGRTQAVITTIVPGQPTIANVSYLGKGTVSGMVRDSSGVVQASIPVKVKSNGVFPNTWSVVTDAAGQYTVAGVFVGDVVATAQNPISRLAGVSNGRLIADGNSLSLNVTLAATGTVRGNVMKFNNLAPASAPILLELYSLDKAVLIDSQTVNTNNAYEFSLVPVGDFRVVATEKLTGDKGVTTSKLGAANEVKITNVSLIGQGGVRVKVQDAKGNPVVGATINIRSLSAFQTTYTSISDSNGVSLVAPIFNGDFSVSASKPAQIGQISGSAQGTIVNGGIADSLITLTDRPTGQIKGVVFGSDGVTPRALVAVYLSPAPNGDSYKVVTDKNGKFVFENVEGGISYTLTAKMDSLGPDDRIRARISDVQIDTQDQVVIKNMQLIGSGSVSGKVKFADGRLAFGVKVVFNNADPVFGTRNFETITDGNGQYSFIDMPVGNFTLRANSLTKVEQAETSSRIKFDGDALQIDLTLVDNAISMPFTLSDANAIPFDVAGDGSVMNGKNNLFTGVGPDARGMRLDILVNGVPVPFKNGDGTIGRLTQSKQQIELDEVHVSGLNVTRRIYVPNNGYFARYIEILENKTKDPITVDLRVTSNHSQSNSNPRIVDSSDGDNVLSVSDTINRDRWIIVDDQLDIDPFQSRSEPATGHLFDGVGGKKYVDIANYDLVGQTGKLSLQWNNITIQPGETTQLMHFVFSQLDRSRAHEAAVRLAQLPPEALVGLSQTDRTAISNFSVPQDGVSSLSSLPELNGSIDGRVLSGDGVTPVSRSTVHFKSKHPLFGRDLKAVSDSSGYFHFASVIDGSTSAVVIPLYAFDLDAVHPQTGAKSPTLVSDYSIGATNITKDVIFNGTGNLRGVVTRPNGEIATKTELKLMTANKTPIYDVDADETANYLMTGVPVSDYILFASQRHPQQNVECCGIEGDIQTTVVSGATTIADVVLETVGSVTGLVRSASGDPVVGATMKLTDSKMRVARRTTTDTAGRYRFTDVKVGETSIEATDEISQAIGSVIANVLPNTESVADIKLKGFGTVNVHVYFARGTPAPASLIKFKAHLQSKRTDSTGLATFNLPVDTYQIIAAHPDNLPDHTLDGENTVTLSNNGDILNVDVTLKSAGAISGTVVRPDKSTLSGGFPYSLKLLNGTVNPPRTGLTDDVGNFRMGGVGIGRYLLTAYDPTQNRFADTEIVIQSDGAEITANLVLKENRIALPANLLDANRFIFDVQGDGSLAKGSNTFDRGGVLEVSGEVFSGDTSALLEAGKRQFSITQPTSISGLNITRKIYVPRGAYFARYLEIFNNPTASPISIETKIRSVYPQAQLVDSATKSASLSSADNWVVLDDTLDGDFLILPQQPTTAHIHSQTGARLTPDKVELVTSGANEPQFIQEWKNLTVPAGGKVTLMHFIVQQINRKGATFAAQRLADLPPEAIEDLTSAEIASIVNFNVPTDGASKIPALPVLTGNIGGRVFEGDSVTPVNKVSVTVQSNHPLFNRVWGMRKNLEPECKNRSGSPVSTLISSPVLSNIPNVTVNGVFSLQGTLNDADSIALPIDSDVHLVAQLPEGCFDDESGHSLTHIPSRQYTVPTGLATQQNIVFDSGVLSGTIKGPTDIGVVTGRIWRAGDDPSNPDTLLIPVATDGTYVFPGLSPGSYDLLIDTPHPQGGKLRGESIQSIVTLGKTTITDIELQETGTLAGAVLTENGEASINSKVLLVGIANDQTYDACIRCVNAAEVNKGKRDVTLQTTTDSLGRYSFVGVPTGTYTLNVQDPISGGIRSNVVVINSGQHVIQNITLFSIGSVQLTVSKANGLPVSDANVYLLADAEGKEKVVGRTDSSGKLTVPNIPFGNYQLRVNDPRFPYNNLFERREFGSIAVNGEVQQKIIKLYAVTNLRITAQDADNQNASLSNVSLMLGQRSVGKTEASGVLMVPSIKEGLFDILAQTELEGTIVNKSMQITIGTSDDDQVRDVVVPINRMVGSVKVLAVDKNNSDTPVDNAAIYLKVAGGKTLVGYTAVDGTLFIPGIVPGNLVLDGQASIFNKILTGSLNGAITPSNIGRTQLLKLSLERGIFKQKVFKFNTERHLYSVPMNAGDTLSVSINGAATDDVPAAYAVAAEVFDTKNNVLAVGYGFDSTNQNRQYSNYGDLKNVKADLKGGYTIATSSYYQTQGGYDIHAIVNNTEVELLPYSGGGEVRGRLTKADGVTSVVNGQVRIATQDALGLSIEAVTDSNGFFVFSNVPLGDYKLSVIKDGVSIAQGQGTLSFSGEISTTNLIQIAATAIRLRVVNLDGTELKASASINIVSSGEVNIVNRPGSTNEIGLANFAFTGNTPIEITAIDSLNYQISAKTTVSPVDGETLDVVMHLPISYVSGKVVSAKGDPIKFPKIKVGTPSDPRFYQYVNIITDILGNFSVHLLANQEVIISANDFDPSVTPGILHFTPPGGEVNNVLVTLPGSGTLRGSVLYSTGRALISQPVRLTWSEPFYGHSFADTITDSSGNFQFNNVPTGILLTLSAYVGNPFNPNTVVSNDVTLTEDGQIFVASPMIVDAGATVIASMRTADNTIGVSGYCDFTVEVNGVSQTLGDLCTAEKTFFGLPPGIVNVSIQKSNQGVHGSVSVSGISGKEVFAKVLISKIMGKVYYRDNSIVNISTVYLIDSNGQMQNAVIDYADSGIGTYAFYGVIAGAYKITAQDEFGLTVTFDGRLDDPQGTSIVDLMISDFGNIKGVVTNSKNQLVPNATVYLRNVEQNFERNVTTDDQGNYYFEKVGLGKIIVSAIDPLTSNVVSKVTTLTSIGQTLSLDLKLPIPGTLSGKVFASDGISVVANANVTLSMLDEGGAFSNYSQSVVTDGAGAFSMINVPPSLVKLSAVDSINNMGSGVIEVKSAENSVLNLILGSDISLPAILKQGDGYSYEISSGENVEAYQNDYDKYSYGYHHYGLVVNGIPFMGDTAGQILQSGKEISVGPRMQSGLLIKRQFFVPASGAYLRVFDTVTNTTTNSVNANIILNGRPKEGGYPSDLQVLNSSSSYSVFAPYSSSTNTGFVTVFKGNAIGSGTNSVNFSNVTNKYSLAWNTLIPAGKTIAVVNFGMFFSLSDLANVQALSDALSNGAASNMWDGLSSTDKALVINFTAPN